MRTGTRRMVAMLVLGAQLSACNISADDGAKTGSKGLWIANGTNVVEYLPGQLGSGTAATVPHLTLKSAAFGSPRGVTFDAAGNLWVMDPTGLVAGAAKPALFEFSAAQVAALATDGAPTPIATVTSTSMKFPEQSVFDVLGNQWVTDHNTNTILVFSAAELARTGENNLNPVLAIFSASFNGPLGIAFDAGGNLWIANNGGVPGAPATAGGAPTVSSAGTTIVEFLLANIPALPAEGMDTSNLAADVTLTDDGQASIQAPWALAFDGTGNLWSSNQGTPFTVVEFNKASLAATGAPAPTAIVSSAIVDGNPSLDGTAGICFDDVGNLAAVGSAGAFGLAFFGQAQLVTGAPLPHALIVGEATTLSAPAGCNFGRAIS